MNIKFSTYAYKNTNKYYSDTCMQIPFSKQIVIDSCWGETYFSGEVVANSNLKFLFLALSNPLHVKEWGNSFVSNMHISFIIIFLFLLRLLWEIRNHEFFYLDGGLACHITFILKGQDF
jgi:hypothetical protein